MGKKYEPVPNDKRAQLVELIHNHGYTISQAASMAGIYYPTAKAINKVYVKENRTDKKAFRIRKKKLMGSPELRAISDDKTSVT